jgi:hypothetical protein
VTCALFHRDGVWGGKPPALAVGRQSPIPGRSPDSDVLLLSDIALDQIHGAPPTVATKYLLVQSVGILDRREGNSWRKSRDDDRPLICLTTR